MTIAFHASAISIRKKPIELDAFEASKLFRLQAVPDKP